MHARDDKYAPVSHAEALRDKHHNANDEFVIFDDSDHANNILKKKQEYKAAVEKFIAKTITLTQ
jgi:pimeloyl-ACP methyl ester carboxylesterase